MARKASDVQIECLGASGAKSPKIARTRPGRLGCEPARLVSAHFNLPNVRCRFGGEAQGQECHVEFCKGLSENQGRMSGELGACGGENLLWVSHILLKHPGPRHPQANPGPRPQPTLGLGQLGQLAKATLRQQKLVPETRADFWLYRSCNEACRLFIILLQPSS